MNASLNIWILLILSLLATYTKQCIAFSPTLRGNTHSNKVDTGSEVQQGRATENDNIIKEQAQERSVDLEKKRKLTSPSISSSSNEAVVIKKETKDKNEEEMNRQLAGEAVAKMFSTPVAQWTLAQWGLLLILIWLIGHCMRRCPCITDILACFCCYELFCDDNPAGFVAC